MKRREFLRKAGVNAAVGAAVVAGAPVVAAAQSAKTFNWKMVTTWPPNFPVLQTGAEEFAKRVTAMSGGRIKIHVFAGGELVPPLQTFDAVSQGTVEMGHSASYYWSGKVPEAQFFSAVPFGFTAQQINAWLYYGGGLTLWNETYAPFNLVVFPAGNSGVQMGGWFNKKINTMADLKGLRMRIPGLGGQVMARAGVNVVLLPGGELYTSLERGVIDALEWVGPYHDLKLGFHRAAKFYYYPGWHEAGTVFEIIINKNAWSQLPDDLKAIVQAAAAQSNVMTLAEFESKNGDALNELATRYKVNIVKFPDEVIKGLKALTKTTMEELARDPKIRKIFDSFKKFEASVGPWNKMSEQAINEAKNL